MSQQSRPFQMVGAAWLNTHLANSVLTGVVRWFTEQNSLCDMIKYYIQKYTGVGRLNV